MALHIPFAQRPQTTQRSSSLIPLALFVSVIGAVTGARLVLLYGLPFPQCWLRKLTDVPCPSCGCTRSLAAWATLDLGQALRFNPLFFLLCVAALVWSALGLVERFSRRTFLDGLKARLKPWPWWKVGAALLALNWLYLCLTLPK